MKKLFFLLLACAGIACQPAKSPEVDVATAQKEVAELMDLFHSTIVNKDATGQMDLLADDGLYAGTDPSEVLSKQAVSEYMKTVFADTAFVVAPYTINKREIKIDDDGQCAYILEQFTMKPISATIQVRFTGHAIRKDGKWMLDFTSLGMIPRNEDIAKMSEVAK